MDVDKGCLPSPEDLKYKILIKAKRSKKVEKGEKIGSEVKSGLPDDDQESESGFKSPLEETMKMAKRISVVISRGSSPDGTSVKDEENRPVEKNGLDEENPPNDEYVKGEKIALNEDNGPDDKNASDTEDPRNQKNCNLNSIPQKGLEHGSNELSSVANITSTSNESSNGNSGPKEKAKDIENPVENVSGELNSIINCLEATKFVQLDDPDRKFWQMFSLKENPAEVLGNKQESAMKLVSLTQRGLARVYPASTRVDSSNYNPIPFWMR